MSRGLGIITGGAGADAAKRASNRASNDLRNYQEKSTNQMQPWSEYGRQAMIPLSQLIYGKNFDPSTGQFTGDVAEGDRFNAFQQSPGYQYQLDQGLKAIQRQNAATGTLLGGNTLKELQEYGSNLANQDYNNYLNTLMQQAGIGQQTDTGIANSYLNTGSQIAGYTYAGGMAKAQQYNNLSNLFWQAVGTATGGKLKPNFGGQGGSQSGNGGAGAGGGGGTYNSSFFTNAGMSSLFGPGAASDINLKENIKKVDEKNGFNIYEFNYKNNPKRYRGVIAQEVQKIMPEAVIKQDGYLAVNYSKIGIEFKEV